MYQFWEDEEMCDSHDQEQVDHGANGHFPFRV